MMSEETTINTGVQATVEQARTTNNQTDQSCIMYIVFAQNQKQARGVDK